MARRKDHTHDELKALAVQAVLTHLQTAPARDLSLRKVAQALGYSPGTLINIFGSYDQLLLAVNAHSLDQLHGQLMQTQPEQHTPVQQLQAFAASYLQFCQQHHHQWQLLFEHRLPEGEVLPDGQQDRIDKLFSTLEQALANINPDATAHERHRASRTIWASVHGICTLSQKDKLFTDSRSDSQQMATDLIRHFITSWQQDSH